jgi:restriction system protein
MFDDHSPIDFELLCKELASFHFGCRVERTPTSRDGGVDLIIYRGSSTEVAECKHYPKGTVGRPIIQKLVGALQGSSSKKGYLLTSGTFSKEAKDYAVQINNAANGLTIELFDGNNLANIYTRLKNGTPHDAPVALAIWTTPTQTFSNLFIDAVLDSRSSFSSTRCQGVSVQRKTMYYPFYVADYSATGEALILSEKRTHRWQGKVWSDPNSTRIDFGEPPHEFNQYPSMDALTNILKFVPGEMIDCFRNFANAKDQIKTFVRANCSELVKYRGQNNVNYTKEITPQDSSIYLNSIRLMYIPHQTFILQLPKATYSGMVLDNISKGHFKVSCTTLSRCTVCGTGTSAGNQVFCAVCNMPAHSWSRLFPDSFRCDFCGRLACRNHVVLNRHGQINCQECLPNGKSLKPRWAFALGIFVTCILNSFVAIGLAALFKITGPAMIAYLWISLGLLIAGAVFLTHSVRPQLFHDEDKTLFYPHKSKT